MEKMVIIVRKTVPKSSKHNRSRWSFHFFGIWSSCTSKWSQNQWWKAWWWWSWWWRWRKQNLVVFKSKSIVGGGVVGGRGLGGNVNSEDEWLCSTWSMISDHHCDDFDGRKNNVVVNDIDDAGQWTPRMNGAALDLIMIMKNEDGHNDHYQDDCKHDYDEHSLTRGRGPVVGEGGAMPRTPHTPPHILPDINNIIFIISGTDIKAYLFFKINISLLW